MLFEYWSIPYSIYFMGTIHAIASIIVKPGCLSSRTELHVAGLMGDVNNMDNLAYYVAFRGY